MGRSYDLGLFFFLDSYLRREMMDNSKNETSFYVQGRNFGSNTIIRRLKRA